MILIYGASYGILIASKLMLAGYDVTCVCKQKEVKLLNQKGFFVEMEGYLKKKISINSKNLIGKFIAIEPKEINLSKIDLIFLAMQEPQYEDANISASLKKAAIKKIPTVSVMNIPPSIYLKNFIFKNFDELKPAYRNFDLWNKFDLNFITHGSADPQIFKPLQESQNIISVRLASNFRISKFKDLNSAKILSKISKKIKNSRIYFEKRKIRVPVNLNIYESFFVPISKWPMLITGNYRCINNNELISIRDAVYNDTNHSEKIYNEVQSLCLSLGAKKDDLISFESYLKVAKKLTAPSSVSRLAFSKNKNFERLDKLVEIISSLKNIKITDINLINKNFNPI